MPSDEVKCCNRVFYRTMPRCTSRLNRLSQHLFRSEYSVSLLADAEVSGTRLTGTVEHV